MSDRFHVTHLPLKGLLLAERQPIGDRRGFLERMYCQETFQQLGIERAIVQINRTLTQACGTVRGMHYQKPPHAEIKIISCLRGEVFDVAIDIRANSPTFLHWHGEILSETNRRTFILPEGFAHGFQTLTEDCELLYFHTASYMPSAEAGIRPDDPKVAIQWPGEISHLSERDASHALLSQDYQGVIL